MKNITWPEFISKLPNWVNQKSSCYYTFDDWVKHYEILILHSLGTNYQVPIWESYLLLLNNKVNPSSTINVNRYYVESI